MKLSIVTIVLVAITATCGRVRGHPGKVTTNVQHTEAENPDENGFWQEKISWKPRWVKYWRQKAVYIPLWKKVWGPVVQKEWVPIPKPPPDWAPEDEEDEKEKW
ncbi:uncharacterized protein LOC129952697 [Eupeodes corollae]|uniref:uncharacterized protein LOC129952697 n=1 Tax=Eupeodes corollae TaxID=290404 RepID=UPI0024932C24|nr:uncharacterized protein LOC129952697 [Eupeodes corollae]